jgi:hypothetical protein
VHRSRPSVLGTASILLVLVVVVHPTVACEEPDCPPVAGACSGSCLPTRALPIDVERSCRSPEVTVGCMPDTNLRGTDAPCVVRVSDGALFQALSGAGLVGRQGWRVCTPEEIERVSRAWQPCSNGEDPPVGSGRTITERVTGDG